MLCSDVERPVRRLIRAWTFIPFEHLQITLFSISAEFKNNTTYMKKNNGKY